MTTFSELISAIEPAGAGIALGLPDDWAQGRTAFGGLSAALCVEAARRAHPDLPPLRSAQFAFAGPASGRLMATPAIVRSGKSATAVSVALTGDAGPATHALLSYGAARPSRVAHTRIVAPDAPDPAVCTPHFPQGMGPTFVQNFDVRFAAGSRPMSGGEPHFVIWARHRDASGAHPETAFIALADAPPPAALAVFPERGPISTLTWSLDLVGTVAADAWLKIVTESEIAGDGYSSQSTAFWDAEGRAIALARQTVAVFV